MDHFTSRDGGRHSSTVARTFLRLSIAWLLIVWGADKLVNPAHGIEVSDWLYFGLFSQRWIMAVFGALEIALGVIVAAGLWRRVAYSATAVITGVTLLGVWRSVLDPWGWYLTGTNALFLPSLIIFAAVLVLLVEEPTAASDARDHGRRPDDPPVHRHRAGAY